MSELAKNALVRSPLANPPIRQSANPLVTHRQSPRHRRFGFTLVEILVVVGIFSTASLIMTNLFLTVTKTQRKIASIQRVMEDARFAVETLGQQIRLGTIDYAWYAQNGIDLYPSPSSQPYVLALRTQTNEQLFFRRSDDPNPPNDGTPNDGKGEQLETCTVTASSPCALTGDWDNVTPADVKVTYLTFQIWPSADPFVETATTTCSAGSPSCPPSYRCDTGADQRCEFATDGRNFQPKVRVTMRSEAVAGAIAEQSRVNIQTLFTTRSPKGQVVNENYADTP